MIRLLAAEWRKATTSRQMYLPPSVALSAIACVGLVAWNGAGIWDGLPPAGRATFSMAPLEYLAVWIAQLGFAVFGVTVVTSEYATGTIRAALLAEPKRWRILAAKAVLVGAVSFAGGQAVACGAFALSRWVVGGRPIPGYDAPLSQALPALFAEGLVVAMFALFGLGLGAMLRSATAAVLLLVLLWHPLPMLLQNLPPPWYEWLSSLMPAALGAQIARVDVPSVFGAALSSTAALWVVAGYVLVPLAIAMWLFESRDVA